MKRTGQIMVQAILWVQPLGAAENALRVAASIEVLGHLENIQL